MIYILIPFAVIGFITTIELIILLLIPWEKKWVNGFGY